MFYRYLDSYTAHAMILSSSKGNPDQAMKKILLLRFVEELFDFSASGYFENKWDICFIRMT